MKALITLFRPAFDWTLNNSIQAALLVGLVLLAQRVLGRKLTPRLRYTLSLLILLRLLLPLAPPSPLSLQNLWPRAISAAAQQAAVVEPASPPAVALESLAVGLLPAPPVAAPLISSPPKNPPAISLAEALVMAWACGLVALITLAGGRYVQWCRLIRHGRRLSDARWLVLLDEAKEVMGVRRPVILVALPTISSPAVFGFGRVHLLLPEAALDELTDQDFRLLFLHEMAHVRRHDILLNLLLMAVQFVHWFNPLVWLGLHRLRADRELVCDAMVLQRTNPEERLGYGTLLLKLMTDSPVTQPMIPAAVPVASSKRELKARIVLIKHHRQSGLAVRVTTGLVAAGLACATFTSPSQQPSKLESRPSPPRLAGGSGLPETANLVIRIDAKGNLTLGQTPVTIGQLKDRLMSELAKSPSPRLSIQATTDAPFKVIVNVMDAYNEAIGVSTAASATDRPSLSVIQAEPAPPHAAEERPRTIEQAQPNYRPQTIQTSREFTGPITYNWFRQLEADSGTNAAPSRQRRSSSAAIRTTPPPPLTAGPSGDSAVTIPAGKVWFRNAALSQVLDIYGVLADRKLVAEQGVKLQAASITFSNREDLTRSQALHLFETAIRDQAGLIVEYQDAKHFMVRPAIRVPTTK